MHPDTFQALSRSGFPGLHVYNGEVRARRDPVAKFWDQPVFLDEQYAYGDVLMEIPGRTGICDTIPWLLR
jgi:hypothetical protein